MTPTINNTQQETIYSWDRELDLFCLHSQECLLFSSLLNCAQFFNRTTLKVLQQKGCKKSSGRITREVKTGKAHTVIVCVRKSDPEKRCEGGSIDREKWIMSSTPFIPFRLLFERSDRAHYSSLWVRKKVSLLNGRPCFPQNEHKKRMYEDDEDESIDRTSTKRVIQTKEQRRDRLPDSTVSSSNSFQVTLGIIVEGVRRQRDLKGDDDRESIWKRWPALKPSHPCLEESDSNRKRTILRSRSWTSY